MIYNSKDEAYREQRAAEQKHKLNLDHTRNKEILKGIGNVDPKYAKHLTLRNELVMNFAMKASGGIELLEQPVCRSCEGIALWDHKTSKGEERAYCFNCHVHTTNPITVKKYLLEHTKQFSNEQLELLLSIGKDDENDKGIIIK